MNDEHKSVANHRFDLRAAIARERSSHELNRELPDVTLEQVQLQFDLYEDVYELLVENSKMCLLTREFVYRIDLDDPLSVSRVPLPLLPREDVPSPRAWLHPSGEMIFLQLNSRNHFLLHSLYSQFKPLPRFKGLNIEFLAFSHHSIQVQSTDIAIVTYEGNVHVACVKWHDPTMLVKKRDDKFVKHAITLKKPVKGLLFSDDFRKLEILTAEGKKMSWLLTSDDLTSTLRQSPEEQILFTSQCSYQCHVSGSSYYCISNSTGEIRSNDHCANRTSGNLASRLDFEARASYRSLVSSDYYLLYLAPDGKSLILMSKLLQLSPISISLQPVIGDEVVLGVTAESTGQTRWLFTNNNIYEIILSNESVSLWYSFYITGEYEHALQIIETAAQSCDSIALRNTIYAKQAYEMLQKGGLGIDLPHQGPKIQRQHMRYLEEGIRLLAKLNELFEKVTLMLLRGSEDESASAPVSNALMRKYFLHVSGHSRYPDEKICKIVLSSLLVNSYLEAIHKGASHEISSKLLSAKIESRHDLMEDMSVSMFSFMKQNLENVDSKMIYELMTVMGFEEQLVRFADLLKDYEFLSLYHIQAESWNPALKALEKLYLTDRRRSMQVIYDTSATLLAKATKPTIELWLTLEDVNYEGLLPAIIQFNDCHQYLAHEQNLTLWFLLEIILKKRVNSSMISDQYLAMLASHSIREDDQVINNAILKTLETLRGYASDSNQQVLFDANFLLRTCLRFGRIEPAVSILLHDLRQYDTALTLSLDSCSYPLSEAVLKIFDEHFLGKNCSIERKNAASASNENNNPFLPGSSKTRLEDGHLNTRRILWRTYARSLIERACNAPDADFRTMRNHVRHLNQGNFCVSERAGAEQAEELTARISPGLPSSQLCEVLDYVFGLSKFFSGSEDLLTLKDLLPLLPESIIIDQFRDDIVESLHRYNNEINRLTIEMEESASTSLKLLKQIGISNLRREQGELYSIIEAGESCCLCREMLIEKDALVFTNCHHGCHKECAARFFLQLKGNYQLKKIMQSIKNLSGTVSKSYLDDFLTKSCPSCNESNLNNIEGELTSKFESMGWSLSHVTISRT